LPIRVEAAAWGPHPVSFELVGAWMPPRVQKAVDPPGWFWAWILPPLCAGLLLAARNLVQQRADWRGALRLGCFAAAMHLAAWMLAGHHVPQFDPESRQLMTVLGVAGFDAFGTMLFYLALEPFLRRRWPWRLTSLNRILAGRWRDPLVGRDLLLGLLAGCVLAFLSRLGPALASLLGTPAPAPIAHMIEPMGLSFRELANVGLTILFALFFFTQIFLLSLVLRKPALYWPGFVLIAMVVMSILASQSAGASPLSIGLTALLIGLRAAVLASVMARIGVLALGCAIVSGGFLNTAVPLTSDAGVWYFGQGVTGALIVLALAVFGFVTATAGRPLFRQGFFGDA
jgi:serine/threonine-protein kinase